MLTYCRFFWVTPSVAQVLLLLLYQELLLERLRESWVALGWFKGAASGIKVELDTCKANIQFTVQSLWPLPCRYLIGFNKITGP